MPDRKPTEPQLQWAIEQQQLIVEAADAKLRRAERLLGQASTERAAAEAHNRADAALLDVEVAEAHLHGLQHKIAIASETAVRRSHRPPPDQGSLFDVG